VEKQLEIWKTDKVWNLTISESKVKSQLFCKRKATEEPELQSKRQKLQREVDTLTKQVQRQAKEITALKFGNPTPRYPRKPRSESSRQL